MENTWPGDESSNTGYFKKSDFKARLILAQSALKRNEFALLEFINQNLGHFI